MPRLTRALVNSALASHLVPRRLRALVLRLWLTELRSWNVAAACFFGSRQIEIGRSCFVNVGCMFDALAPIRIGDRCHLGMRVSLLTSGHEIGDKRKRAGQMTSGAITIGDGCWIGAGATVLPGVEIGDGCIVAAGALVSSDCEPDGLYAGTPARRMRDLA